MRATLAVFLLAGACAAAPSGTLHDPERAATVLIFITQDCPISNAYAPEINRIVEEYAARRIEFLVVHVDPHLAPSEMLGHTAEYGFHCRVIHDKDHVLVRRAAATMVPEAAVFGPGDAILYRGRIDDAFVALGKRRPEPTTRDLRAALDAILVGRAPAVAATTVVGCIIPER